MRLYQGDEIKGSKERYKTHTLRFAFCSDPSAAENAGTACGPSSEDRGQGGCGLFRDRWPGARDPVDQERPPAAAERENTAAQQRLSGHL